MTSLTQQSIENTVIRASAGSGKTTALTGRYLHLLASGAHCQSILATTFTRKAAGEILDRIMEGLSSSSLDESAARELGVKLQLAPFDSAIARAMLRHMLSQLHRIQIGTLDSFFAKLARSFSLEIGLHPDWEIVEESAHARLRLAAVGDVLALDESMDLLQWMAKGKSLRAAHQQLMQAVDRLYGLYLDSQPGAWFQLHQRPTLPSEKIEEALRTIGRVELGDNRMAKARDDDCERASKLDWDAWISKGLAAKIADQSFTYYGRPIPVELREAYGPLIEHVVGLVQNELKASTEATYDLLDRYHHRFTAIQGKLGALRFDDVTRRLVQFVDSAGDRTEPAWMFRLDWEIDHLLLDEFQDTSPDQWRVIQPFARRVTKLDSPRSFFCVGDMKQAIYGWRGGVAEVFDLVGKIFPVPDARELDKSFRSAQPIIDAVNRVFENVHHFESGNPLTNAAVQHWQGHFRHHTTDKCDLDGHVVLERIAADQDSLAVAVARIKEIYERSPNRTIAVLTPENDDVKEFIFELQAAGVPASEEGGNPLTDSAAVLSVLSLLQLSDHPHDSVAWFQVSQSPLAELYDIPACEREREKSPETLRRVHVVAAAVRRELGEVGYSATVARWAAALVPSCTRRELRRLQRLIEMADEYDSQPTLRPADFVELVHTKPVDDPTGSPVRVMTIHKAKGLEFDVVVLPRLSKSFGPLDHDLLILRESPTAPISFACRYANAAQRRILPPEIREAHEQQFNRHISEAMCVLYVVLTRAVHSLHMFVEAGDKPSSQSMAGILLSTLGDSSRQSGVLYEHGNAGWAAGDSEKKRDDIPGDSLAARRPLRAAQVGLTLAESGSTWSRNLPAIHPSQIVSPRATVAEVLRHFTDRSAVERGTVIHAGLAEIQWLDDEGWRDRLSETLRRRFPGYRDLSKVMEDISRMIERPVLSRILRRTSYLDQIASKISPSQFLFDSIAASVESERAFAVRLDEAIWHGTIDRLVAIRQSDSLVAAEVIEFKSDQLSLDDEKGIALRLREYQPQIGAYRRAVAALFGLPLNRVFARLVLVGIDREFEVR